jgi:hypothetical protein
MKDTRLIIRLPKAEKKRVAKYAKFKKTTVSELIRNYFLTLNNN